MEVMEAIDIKAKGSVGDKCGGTRGARRILRSTVPLVPSDAVQWIGP